MSRTELVIGCKLRSDTPSEVITVLEWMCRGGDSEAAPPEAAGHALFETERWHKMLCGASAFHVGLTGGRVERDRYIGAYDLAARSSFKNYDNETDLFFDWLAPYILTAGVLGYVRGGDDPGASLIYRDASGGVRVVRRSAIGLPLLCPKCRRRELTFDEVTNEVRCGWCAADDGEMNQLIEGRAG